MIINFTENGNLHEPQTLSYGEFKKVFGFNQPRKEKIDRALLFLKILNSFGCIKVYVTGSFVSNEEYPNDIDLCVYDEGVDYLGFTKEYPDFLQPKRIEKMKKEHGVHFVLFFGEDNKGYIERFKKDRSGHPRALVEIYLNDIDTYT